MSDSDSESESTRNPAAEIFEKVSNFVNHPTSTGAHFAAGSSSSPLNLRRRKNVHEMLGGGHISDVLLWRKKHLSAGFLVASTLIWLLFEWVGYHFISVIAFVLLAAVVFLFLWSYGADFLNRPPPPVRKLQLTDEQVFRYARIFKDEVNWILATFYEIAMARDITRFMKLVGALAFLVLFGSWFRFPTLLFFATLAAHTLPVLYDKHGETIDQLAGGIFSEMNSQYRKFDDAYLSKIPRKQFSFQRRRD